MDYSLPGSSVQGILQARILELVARQGIFPIQGLNLHFLMSSALQAEFFTNCTVREASKLPYDPAIPLLSIYTEKKHGLKGYRHLDVHCSTIYKSQDMEETSMAIDRGMDK